MERNVVDAHPVSATLAVIVDTAKLNVVVESFADLAVYVLERERWSLVDHTEIGRSNNRFFCHNVAVKIDLDAVPGIGILPPFVEIVHIPLDEQRQRRIEGVREVEVIAK